MDILGRYYTENKISNLLVNGLKQHSPEKIIDLGVGGGSLIQAAYNRWLNARFYAADIDRKKINSMNHKLPFVNIVYANGLSSDIDKKLNISVGSIDVAICNPPYLKIQNQKRYSSIFEEALIKDCENLKTITSDLIFLAQNLKMLKTEGELGIILPDSLLTGHNFEQLRTSLILNHKITSIVQLPDNVFKKTEARTHIIFIEKGLHCNNEIPLFKASSDGLYEKEILVSKDQLIHRMDFDFHNWEQENDSFKKYFTLSDLNVEIKRGSLTHKELKENHNQFFHTTDFKNVPKDGVIASAFTSNKSQLLTAIKGDILLARVGKRCIGKVTIVKEGELVISDCIYRIRTTKKNRAKVFKSFKSFKGQEWLRINAHGVCAQVISKTDLLNFPLYSQLKD